MRSAFCMLGSLCFVVLAGCPFQPPADECTTDVDCMEGEVCTDGQCVAETECTDDTDCDDGNDCTDDVCNNGTCENTDAADGTACDDSDECTENDACSSGTCAGDAIEDCCTEDADCDDGDACTTDTCTDGSCSNEAIDDCCNSDEDCAEGETCVDNVCTTDGGNGMGDAELGEAFYIDNGCTACHGANAEGGIGPSLVGADAESILMNLDGTDPHAVTVDGVTEDDAANLEAWLATL